MRFSPVSLLQSDHQMKHSSTRSELAQPGPLHTHDPPTQSTHGSFTLTSRQQSSTGEEPEPKSTDGAAPE